MRHPPQETPPATTPLQRIDRAVLAANRWLMIAALALMSVIIFANVVTRYLTDYSIPWSEELGRYLMIWLTFLGAGPVLRVGGHVAVDTLPDALPPAQARVLRLFIVAAVAGFCVVVAWQGFSYVQRTLQQNTAVLEIPFGWVAAAVPVGMVLALWHLAAVAGGFVRDKRFESSADMSAEDAVA